MTPRIACSLARRVTVWTRKCCGTSGFGPAGCSIRTWVAKESNRINPPECGRHWPIRPATPKSYDVTGHTAVSSKSVRLLETNQSASDDDACSTPRTASPVVFAAPEPTRRCNRWVCLMKHSESRWAVALAIQLAARTTVHDEPESIKCFGCWPVAMPTDEEQDACTDLLESLRQRYRADTEGCHCLLRIGEAPRTHRSRAKNCRVDSTRHHDPGKRHGHHDVLIQGKVAMLADVHGRRQQRCRLAIGQIQHSNRLPASLSTSPLLQLKAGAPGRMTKLRKQGRCNSSSAESIVAIQSRTVSCTLRPLACSRSPQAPDDTAVTECVNAQDASRFQFGMLGIESRAVRRTGLRCRQRYSIPPQRSAQHARAPLGRAAHDDKNLLAASRMKLRERGFA